MAHWLRVGAQTELQEQIQMVRPRPSGLSPLLDAWTLRVPEPCSRTIPCAIPVNGLKPTERVPCPVHSPGLPLDS